MISRLRKPYSNEADDCVKLIYISGPDLYTYIFFEREPKIYEFIKLMYDSPDTLFSKENAIVEAEDGKIRGLVLAYPASYMKKIVMGQIKSIKGIFKISGLYNLVIILLRLRLNKYFPRTENDEFFISSLAVFEEYRGKGIAVRLLKKAEDIANEKGLNKLSLYVETDNLHAKRIYERFGFQEVKKVVLPEKYNNHNIYGFFKMIKEICAN